MGDVTAFNISFKVLLELPQEVVHLTPTALDESGGDIIVGFGPQYRTWPKSLPKVLFSFEGVGLKNPGS